MNGDGHGATTWFNDEQGFGFTTPDDPGKDPLGSLRQGWTSMASGSKKKTTMAKLTRESKLRERRLDKQAKKDARKQASADHPDRPGDPLTETWSEPAQTAAGEPEAVDQTLADA
jgi:hypothetical protein